MGERLDDLLLLGYQNGQIKDSSFSFMLRMQAAENRKYHKRMSMLFGSSDKKKQKEKSRKGAVNPKLNPKFEAARLKRLKEHGLIK